MQLINKIGRDEIVSRCRFSRMSLDDDKKYHVIGLHYYNIIFSILHIFLINIL